VTDYRCRRSVIRSWTRSPATPKIPAWLRRHLHDTGAMIDGVTRSARIQTCKHCGRP
jgi:hypothetical protein